MLNVTQVQRLVGGSFEVREGEPGYAVVSRAGADVSRVNLSTGRTKALDGAGLGGTINNAILDAAHEARVDVNGPLAPLAGTDRGDRDSNRLYERAAGTADDIDRAYFEMNRRRSGW